MQPIITLLQTKPKPKSTFTFVREHVAHHRDVWVLEAFHEAVKEAQLLDRPFLLLDQILVTERDGNLAERLVAAFARLDTALRDSLKVETIDGRVRLTLTAGNTMASATEDETGWVIESHQTSWSDPVVH